MAIQNYIHPTFLLLLFYCCFLVACTEQSTKKKHTDKSLLSSTVTSKSTSSAPAFSNTPAHPSSIDLVAAVQAHDIATTQKILKKFKKKVDVNYRDQYQKTVLFYAIEYGDLPLIKQLLAAGADVNSHHPSLGTPIFAVIGRGWGKDNAVFEEDKIEDIAHDKAILDELLKQGADLSARLTSQHKNCIACPEDITPLHYAVYTANYPLARRLIQKGASVDVLNHRKQTPLHFAAIFEDVENIDLLLRNKANPNAQDELGLTPLHYAAQWGKAMATEKLIEYKADVNIKDVRHRTPLHHTLLNYSMSLELEKIFVIELLLENQANVYLQDRARTSFINLAKGIKKKYPSADIAGVLDDKVLGQIKQVKRGRGQNRSNKRIAYILYDENGNMKHVYEDATSKSVVREPVVTESNMMESIITEPIITTVDSRTLQERSSTVGSYVPNTTEGVGNPDIFNHIGISKETYKRPVSGATYYSN